MSKKLLSPVTIIAIVLMVSLFVACGSGGTLLASTDKAGVVKEIKVWHYFSDFDKQELEKVCSDYNKLQNKVKITPTYVSRDDLMKQYTMGAVSGQLPNIGMMDNPDMASFAKMGILLDITDKVNKWGQKNQFFEGPLKSCTLDGRIYGLPQNSNCLALFYDVDMLKAAGVEVPKTWDELSTACAKLTKPGVYGLAISAPKNEEGTFQFMPWFISAGADISSLNSPGAIKSLAFLTDLLKKGYMSKEVINMTQADVCNAWIAGKTAMMINGPWNIPLIQKNAPNKKWAVALVPKDQKYASVLGGENFGICKGTDIDAAFDFLKYLDSKEVSAKFCLAAGKFSPRKDSMASSEKWTKDPVLSVFSKAMEGAMPRGPHPRWPEVSNAISSAMNEAFTGAKSPDEAMNEASTKVKALMQ
jgi:multiple sugar transport system substrate-binding protein